VDSAIIVGHQNRVSLLLLACPTKYDLPLQLSRGDSLPGIYRRLLTCRSELRRVPAAGLPCHLP